MVEESEQQIEIEHIKDAHGTLEEMRKSMAYNLSITELEWYAGNLIFIVIHHMFIKFPSLFLIAP